MELGSLTMSAACVAALSLTPSGCSLPPRANGPLPAMDAGLGNVDLTLNWKVVRAPGPDLPTLAAVWARGDDV